MWDVSFGEAEVSLIVEKGPEGWKKEDGGRDGVIGSWIHGKVGSN